jgi:hypothetical protein
MMNKFIGILFLMATLSGASTYRETTYESSNASFDLRGLGVRLSLVAPEVFNVGFGLGAYLDFRILKYFHFVPGFEYSHAGYNYGYYPVGIYPYSSYPYHSLNEFAFNGDLRFYFPVNTAVIRPYAGGGPALLVINENWSNYYSNPNYSNTYLGIAADFIAGLDIPTGNFTWNVEMKGKVGTGFNMFKLSGGVMFTL